VYENNQHQIEAALSFYANTNSKWTLRIGYEVEKNKYSSRLWCVPDSPTGDC